MASIISTAVAYFFFAISFTAFNLMQMRINVTSEMYQAISSRFLDIPFTERPDRKFSDIGSPSDVYDFLTKVFVPQMQSETFQNGMRDGYCSPKFPCGLNEGGAGANEECSEDLQQGEDNCPVWMGIGMDCCEPCSEPFAGLGNYSDGTLTIPEAPSSCPSGDPLCQERCQPRKEIATVNGTYVLNTVVDDLSAACMEPNRGMVAGSVNQFCPEADDAVTVDEVLRPVMLAGYSRVLMGRFSLKRYKVQTNDLPRYQSAYHYKLADSSMRASRYNGDDVENTTTLVNPINGYEDEYKMDGGFMDAGAYVRYIDPDLTQDELLQQLSEMRSSGWFTMDHGSFVTDLVVYNGNAKKFMHFSLQVEQTLAGTANTFVHAVPFDISLMDLGDTQNVVRIIIEVVIIMLFLFFLKNQFDEITDDTWGFFTNVMSLVDVASFTLCFVCLLMYYMYILQPAYQHFQFPLPPRSKFSEREESYLTLCDLAFHADWMSRLVAVNICFIFVRLVTLLADVSPKFGIVISTLAQGKENLANFLLLFFSVFLGFVVAFYFLFGTSIAELSTVGDSFLSSFTMVLGQEFIGDLTTADPYFSYMFYIPFMILFSFILANIFLSIIISAYNDEQLRIRDLAEDQDPVKRLISYGRTLLMDQLSKLGLRQFFMWQVIFVDKDTRRTNKDEVARLKAAQRKYLGIFSQELLAVLSMFSVYYFMVNRISKVDTVFNLVRAQQLPLKTTTWRRYQPTQTMRFDNIAGLDDAYEWADNILAPQVLQCVGSVDATTGCEDSPDRTNYKLMPGGMDDIKQVDYPYPGWWLYHTSTAEITEVPRIAQWNVGFAPNNFMRLTFQQRCFSANTVKIWMAGYPFLLSDDRGEDDCSATGCMEAAVLAGVQCYDAEGNPYDIQEHEGSASKFRYQYSKPYSHRKLGGYVVGLGATPAEAREVLLLLERDKVFSRNTASVVIDWVVYNGHVDLFSYNKVTFSLLPTGALHKRIDTQPFPMNLYGGGNHSTDLNINLVLMIIYVLLAIFFVDRFRHYFLLQCKLSTEKLRRMSTLVDFFKGDPWNYADVVSMCLNLNVIVLWLMFSFYADEAFSLDSFTTSYEFSTAVAPTSVQKLDEFANLAENFGSFTMWSSLNTFFMAVRILKYLGTDKHIGQLGRIMSVISSGATLIFNFILIMFCLLLGFTFMFHFEYGVFIEHFNSPQASFVTCFRFMTGSFTSELEMMRERDAIFAGVSFVVYQLFFYFIIANMFLSIIIAKWKQIASAEFTQVNMKFEAPFKDRDINVGDMIVQEDTSGAEGVITEITEKSLTVRVESGTFLKVGRVKVGRIRPEILDEPQEIIGTKRDEPNLLDKLWSCTKKAAKSVKELGSSSQKEEALDTEYWRSLSALQFLPFLKETGMIKLEAKDALNDGAPAGSLEAFFKETQEKCKTLRPKEIQQKFYQAGMANAQRAAIKEDKKDGEDDAASDPDDDGKGVGDFEGEGENGDKKKGNGKASKGKKENKGDQDSFKGIGYIAQSLSQQHSDKLKRRVLNFFEQKIKQEDIWLDALVTAVEETQGIKFAQELFRYPRFVDPQGNKQMEAYVNNLKEKTEKRMDGVVQILKARARLKHQDFLSQNAGTKEKILKSQSLVLAEYVKQLDEEIKGLEKSNLRLRGLTRQYIEHVAPLVDDAKKRGRGGGTAITNGTGVGALQDA